MVWCMNKYPEHEKLKEIQENSQACANFLDWLQNDKGVVLGKYKTIKDWDERDTERLLPTHVNIQNLLAEYFEIDQAKLEQEKRAILDEIRKNNKS